MSDDDGRDEIRDEIREKRKNQRLKPTTDNFEAFGAELAELRDKQAKDDADRASRDLADEKARNRAELKAELEKELGVVRVASVPALPGVPGLPAAAVAISKNGKPSQWAVDLGYVAGKLPAPAVVLAVLFFGLWWMFKNGIL